MKAGKNSDLGFPSARYPFQSREARALGDLGSGGFHKSTLKSNSFYTFLRIENRLRLPRLHKIYSSLSQVDAF